VADKHFPTTAWTAVEQAASDQKALNALLKRYWTPLWNHLVATRRLSESEADDVLQEFLTSRVLEKQLLAQAERGRGRFRWFLCTSLNNFLKDRRRAAAAQKAAPDRARGIEAGDDPVSPGEEAGAEFEASWGLSVLAHAVRRMEAECQACGRADLWTAFQARAGRIMQRQEPVSYAVLVEMLGARDEKQAANTWATAQAKFQRVLQQSLKEFGADNPREELIDLKAAVVACGPELFDKLRMQLWSEIPAMSADSDEDRRLGVDAVVGIWTNDELAETACDERWRSLLQISVAPAAAGDVSGTILSVLEDEAPPVVLLERIKDFSKDLRGGASEESAGEVATVLYYLSIAIGLTKAKQLITEQDLSALKQGFLWAAGRPWLDVQFKARLTEAANVKHA
jgi:hypothetical protein